MKGGCVAAAVRLASVFYHRSVASDLPCATPTLTRSPWPPAPLTAALKRHKAAGQRVTTVPAPLARAAECTPALMARVRLGRSIRAPRMNGRLSVRIAVSLR